MSLRAEISESKIDISVALYFVEDKWLRDRIEESESML